MDLGIGFAKVEGAIVNSGSGGGLGLLDGSGGAGGMGAGDVEVEVNAKAPLSTLEGQPTTLTADLTLKPGETRTRISPSRFGEPFANIPRDKLRLGYERVDAACSPATSFPPSLGGSSASVTRGCVRVCSRLDGAILPGVHSQRQILTLRGEQWARCRDRLSSSDLSHTMMATITEHSSTSTGCMKKIGLKPSHRPRLSTILCASTGNGSSVTETKKVTWLSGTKDTNGFGAGARVRK